LETFEKAAIDESEIIDRLVVLCRELLADLSRHKSIEAEEQILKELEDKT
jgi:hypothetical protein